MGEIKEGEGEGEENEEGTGKGGREGAGHRGEVHGFTGEV